MTLDEYKEDFLMQSKLAKTRSEFMGVQTCSNRDWLKTKLLGWPKGVAYSTVIPGDLVLKIAMFNVAEDARESRLFQKRLATMEQIISTVQVSVVEIRAPDQAHGSREP